MRVLYVTLSLVLLVGTACGSAQVSGEVSKASPTVAPATVAPTATTAPTSSPTPSVTVTPAPTVAATATPVPTQAATPVPTEVPTVAPAASVAASSQTAIGVIVTDASTGKPIANASVAVIPADQCQAPNLSDVPGGKYFLTNASGMGDTGLTLGAGSYKVQVQASGYQRQWWKQQAGCGNATPITVTGARGKFVYEIALIKN